MGRGLSIVVLSTLLIPALFGETTRSREDVAREEVPFVVSQELSLPVGGEPLAELERLAKGDLRVPFILRATTTELVTDGKTYPVSIVRLVSVEMSNRLGMPSIYRGGMWIRDLRSDSEACLASYQALLLAPASSNSVLADEAGFRRLQARDTIALTVFGYMTDGKVSLTLTNGPLDDYGEENPLKKHEIYAQLYEMMETIWSGSREDLAAGIAASSTLQNDD